MRRSKLIFLIVIIISIVVLYNYSDNKFTFDFRKGVPFISSNIAESKKYNLFVAKYKVKSIQTNNFPIDIKEVWFELKAYYTEKEDSLEIYEKPGLTFSVDKKTDCSALVTLIGGATVSPFENVSVLRLHPFASNYTVENLPLEISIPLIKSKGRGQSDTIGNINLIKVWQ